MDDRELKERVINILSQQPAYQISASGLQHVVRCPYCGDSKNYNHSHFSIKIDPSDPDTPMLYRCLRCPVSGILTPAVLSELGVVLDSDTETAFKKIRTTTRYNKYTDMKMEDVDALLYENTPVNLAKLQYLNGRLGTDFTLEDCKNMRIIFDFSVFSFVNELKHIETLTPKGIKLLDDAYIGFLSTNRNVVTYRLTKDIPYKRYYKLKINYRNLDPNSYYNIPNKFDPLYDHDITIHIAEGTFDILSIYANLNNKNLENNYYYAVCGFGYNTIINNLIAMGLNTGLNIHIYADSDKTDKEILFKVMNPRNLPWIDHLYIHRNAYENDGKKDYGVVKDKIQDTIRKII